MPRGLTVLSDVDMPALLADDLDPARELLRVRSAVRSRRHAPA